MKDKKDKMLNVRLDEQMNDKLNQYSVQQDTSKSSIVSDALVMYFSKEELKQSPYRLGMDLFGTASSGDTTLSVTYKSKLKDKLAKKHAH